LLIVCAIRGLSLHVSALWRKLLQEVPQTVGIGAGH